MSAQCQELNRLFSQCVDGDRINIPKRLETPPSSQETASPFILDVLHRDGEKRVHDFLSVGEADSTGYDVDAIQLLLTRDDIAASEFECIKWAQAWCAKTRVSFETLLHMFDFNVLTAEEKAWVLVHIPPSSTVPALITNALCSSSILERGELHQFKLDHPGMKWKRTYDSSRDRLATFHDAASTNLEMFHRTLIVFRPDERLTIAIYMPKRIPRSQDCQIDDVGRLFAFPHSQGPQKQHRLALPTKRHYQVYCDGNRFQLFEGKRDYTWVSLSRPGTNDQDYRDVKNRGDRRRKQQVAIDSGKQAEIDASIALDKFSENLKTHIGRVRKSPVTAAVRFPNRSA